MHSLRSGYLQLYTRNSRAIRLDEHRVVEEGCNVLERDIMNFIAVNAITPVSKTYKIKLVEVRKTFYIVIDYMHGEPLDKAWMYLTQGRRAYTCRQIAGYLEELRQLTGK
ncbi:hypothetical protein RJZ57_000527 [Blastomyces gilchristii]